MVPSGHDRPRVGSRRGAGVQPYQVGGPNSVRRVQKAGEVSGRYIGSAQHNLSFDFLVTALEVCSNIIARPLRLDLPIDQTFISSSYNRQHDFGHAIHR